MKTYDTFTKIRGWAHARNLVSGSTPEKQFIKLHEELGEMAAGMARGDQVRIMDGIGDAMVVLTILAEQQGYTVESCLEMAWDEIKDRKGRMVDGIFVKEADL